MSHLRTIIFSNEISQSPAKTCSNFPKHSYQFKNIHVYSFILWYQIWCLKKQKVKQKAPASSLTQQCFVSLHSSRISAVILILLIPQSSFKSRLMKWFKTSVKVIWQCKLNSILFLRHGHLEATECKVHPSGTKFPKGSVDSIAVGHDLVRHSFCL